MSGLTTSRNRRNTARDSATSNIERNIRVLEPKPRTLATELSLQDGQLMA
ncbi:hypothetical protein ACFORO_20265 [Amycolatopsis halotolerans]|uniref:Uncharacterized protein n=1 Tax=Amycolatopsis halotolerans TaxID=330083 RepID=A0ABV7QKQ8_9PSEU